jgi:hypothetical protein
LLVSNNDSFESTSQLVTIAQCLGVDPYQAIGVPQTRDVSPPPRPQLPASTYLVQSSWTCDGTPDPGEVCGDPDACGGFMMCETGTPAFSTAPSGPTTTPTPTPNQYIHPSANAAKCLTASSNADGALVEVEDCTSAGSTSQS